MTEDSAEKIGLRTLEDISGLILHSHDLDETLGNIVTLVAKRMGSDVCSIYLLEADGETLVLKATRGLSKGSVGKIAMKTSEGLTGLVLEERGVVSIENAPAHPRYKYFRETREERFNSFLGIPLFERKTPIGVIVVQTRETRRFTSSEISTLSTIAWQISSIVINAKLLDSIRTKEEERAFYERELAKVQGGKSARGKRAKKPGTLSGIPVSPGFSWGKVYILERRDHEKMIGIEEARPRQEEKKRFLLALEKAKIHTLYMEKRIARTLSEDDASIFHTHLMIMEDRGFIGKILELIEQDRGAARGVREAVDYYRQIFREMDDPYLRERSADIEDIGRRIIACLDGHSAGAPRLRESRVLAADEILPSDLASLDDGKIIGIITERGDVNSHAAIMARSLGIPAVVGVEGLLKYVGLRDEVIVDGTSGHIYLNPTPKVRTEYERLQSDFNDKRRELEEIRDLPAVTTDGVRVFLRANIGLLSDIRLACANGAEGVGLYRTEFPYMARSAFPSREEQFRIYRKILEGFPGEPVVIRTLDIGGDKTLPYFVHPREDNPFMGWRSIRISLECRDIFREQLAAVLMASVYGKATLMFPMVSGMEEVHQIRGILDDVRNELAARSVSFDPQLRTGVMVELPAAVQIAGLLAREVDYLSIGTNDLIQYTLAADRNNPRVKRYYDPHHPAVLRSIRTVAEAAGAEGKTVSVCGEMAADPMTAILLLGLGIGEFSVAAPSIPAVKQAIRGISSGDAREIATAALRLETGSAIAAFLDGKRRELGLPG